MSSPRRSRTRILATAVTAAAGLALTAAAPAAQAQSAGTQEALLFQNGAPITTVDGELMHAHGGGVLTVGDTYYMVGEQRVADGYLFGAVSMYRSTDLVNWTHANDILTPASHPDLDPANIERPKVVYNAEYDHYVMWAHKENGVNYNDAEIAVAVSDTVDGDYTYQGAFRPLGHESRDQTVFVDDDGTAYLISAARVNYDLHIYRLTDDYLDVDELVHVFVGDHREAPAVFQRNGVYFLVTSGASGWNPNQQRYATTTSFPDGPWSNWTNVGDATGFGSQTTFVLEISGTEDTTYLYMGDRWAPPWGGTPNDSHYVWLPLAFPSDDQLAMNWYPQLRIDAAAGTVEGVPGSGDGGRFTSTFVNAASDKCVDVPGGSSADGTRLIQWGCWGGTNQSFQFRPLYPDGALGTVASAANGKCWDIPGQSTDPGTPLTQWGCWNGANQTFNLRRVGDTGYYQIVASHSRLCLQVEDGSTEDHARIVQGACADLGAYTTSLADVSGNPGKGKGKTTALAAITADMLDDHGAQLWEIPGKP